MSIVVVIEHKTHEVEGVDVGEVEKESDVEQKVVGKTAQAHSRRSRARVDVCLFHARARPPRRRSQARSRRCRRPRRPRRPQSPVAGP